MVLPILCVWFFRAERGKTKHQRRMAPLCRRRKTADRVSPVIDSISGSKRVSNNDMLISVEKGIMIPMRDGVRLATDIYRPAQSQAQPVLLTRLPYSKEKDVFLWIPPQRACQAGYVVVVQDTRGRYASEGEFPRPFDQDDVDGADTIAWIAQQPWCNGN